MYCHDKVNYSSFVDSNQLPSRTRSYSTATRVFWFRFWILPELSCPFRWTRVTEALGMRLVALRCRKQVWILLMLLRCFSCFHAWVLYDQLERILDHRIYYTCCAENSVVNKRVLFVTIEYMSQVFKFFNILNLVSRNVQ